MLYAILSGEAPVRPAMALRLAKFFGNSPDFWLNLQSRYELHRLAREMRDELARIPLAGDSDAA